MSDHLTVTHHGSGRARLEHGLHQLLGDVEEVRPGKITAWAKSFRDCLAGRIPTPRKASIRRMVAAAEKAGKTVTSVTMPDGTVLHFGASDERNEWDEVLRHGTH